MCHRPSIALAAGGLAFAAAALLTGCSGNSGSSSSGPSAGIAAPANGALPARNAAGSAAGSSAGNGATGKSSAGSGQSVSAARIAPSAQRLVYTAQVGVRAANAATAVTRATAIVTGAGGYVASENLTSPGPAVTAESGTTAQPAAVIQFKVPVTVYAATLARLDDGAIGTRVSLQQQTQDVTQQVADVGSQVTSDRAAIAQLRGLLSHAGSVGDLLSVQNQISSEESDLESLEAQHNALNHETAYGTVTLTVTGPTVIPPARKAAAAPPGLLRGLAGGWHAFIVVLEWLLTVAGAVAPFAAAAAAAGYAAYRVRRRFKSPA